MEKIIEKINQIEDSDTAFVDWSLIEKKRLLEIYFIICKKVLKYGIRIYFTTDLAFMFGPYFPNISYISSAVILKGRFLT